MPVTTTSHSEKIKSALDDIYSIAQQEWVKHTENQQPVWLFGIQMESILSAFWEKSVGNATAAITNLTTCLICKVVEPSVDPRYHRQPKKNMPAPPIGRDYFSGRSISESIIAPWLKKQKFETANSGWQTRTFERPHPYDTDYPENIAYIKDEFLQILDYAQSNDADFSRQMLIYLFFRQIQHRETQQFTLTIPRIRDIRTIIGFLDRHFNIAYSQRGVARLPVLAIYAIYQCVIPQMERYRHDGKTLAPLERHEAADVRTGAVGDIEIHDGAGQVVEAVEIKHKITIDANIISLAYEKFHGFPSMERYYILTTATPCGGQDIDSTQVVEQILKSHGAEVIVNGVLPTIKYYLRLLNDPAAFLPKYVALLDNDQSIGYEHRKAWNNVVLNIDS